MRRTPLLLSFALLLCSACGRGEDRADTAARSTEDSPGAAAGGTATTIHLVISGGQHAGTYDATSSKFTCTHGFAGPGAWGNQYSVTGKKPNEFSSLQLIVADTKDAADGTDQFLLTVGFGELFQPGYTEHSIKTQPGASKQEGSGTVTVDDREKTGKVTFKGKTAEGVTLEGTIDCHQVMRGGG
ncbi:MAG: hypothetical protein ACREMZ_13555 [Gemmatimonadales bacterium]